MCLVVCPCQLNVYHQSTDCLLAAAAEKAIQITRSLIELAKIENSLAKSLTMYVVELALSSGPNVGIIQLFR